MKNPWLDIDCGVEAQSQHHLLSGKRGCLVLWHHSLYRLSGWIAETSCQFLCSPLPVLLSLCPHDSLGLLEEDTQWLLLWSYLLKVAVIFHSIYHIKLHAVVIGEVISFLLSWNHGSRVDFFMLILCFNVN